MKELLKKVVALVLIIIILSIGIKIGLRYKEHITYAKEDLYRTLNAGLRDLQYLREDVVSLRITSKPVHEDYDYIFLTQLSFKESDINKLLGVDKNRFSFIYFNDIRRNLKGLKDVEHIVDEDKKFLEEIHDLLTYVLETADDIDREYGLDDDEHIGNIYTAYKELITRYDNYYRDNGYNDRRNAFFYNFKSKEKLEMDRGNIAKQEEVIKENIEKYLLSYDLVMLNRKGKGDSYEVVLEDRDGNRSIFNVYISNRGTLFETVAIANISKQQKSLEDVYELISIVKDKMIGMNYTLYRSVTYTDDEGYDIVSTYYPLKDGIIHIEDRIELVFNNTAELQSIFIENEVISDSDPKEKILDEDFFKEDIEKSVVEKLRFEKHRGLSIYNILINMQGREYMIRYDIQNNKVLSVEGANF